MREPRPLRIVHTSDVHLGAYGGNDSPAWVERRRRMEAAFCRVIEVANREGADALILAGDIFDNDRVPAETVEWAAAQLARFEGRAFLIPGNHDPMDPGSIYWRYDMEAVARRLTIVRAHGGEVIEPEGLDLVVWGRAYLESDWRFRPLEGLPGRVDRRWHIALGHGHFVPEGGETYRSLPIHEREIIAARGDWDYIALGHWEPHADVSRGGVTAVYSGAPMPLSDANRRAGLCTVVDFGPWGVRWRAVRVDGQELTT